MILFALFGHVRTTTAAIDLIDTRFLQGEVVFRSEDSVYLGLVVSAGSFWSGSGVKSRPKTKDEQTLVGGAIWSQILIPIGLMISRTVGEDLDIFVHGYFLLSGVALLISTGFFLIFHECLMVIKQRRRVHETIQSNENISNPDFKFDIIYFLIGILCLLADSIGGHSNWYRKHL
ncbi:hypothetical protein evm_006165 [Chilo suppressalis]|nr:hypothetical protein evm_006165 [Chilo suppressalis]